MNRFEGAFRYLQLFASMLLLSGCSYLPSTIGGFADKKEPVIKREADQPKIAATGGVKHEPETVAELDLPKPRWKPDSVPEIPKRNIEATEAAPVEDVETRALVENAIENADVQQLLGMSFLEVKEKLGQPAWIRDVYPARVWGYDMDACSLQVFFYPKLDQEGDYRVLAYESGLQDEAAGTETLLGDAGKPLDTDAPTSEPEGISELEQKLVQACFQKLLESSASNKVVLPSSSLPEP